MGEELEVVCPWCFEPVSLWVDRDTRGSYVEDCEVCCRPWQVYVQWDDDADRAWVDVERADG
jgi:hypothetical protein